MKFFKFLDIIDFTNNPCKDDICIDSIVLLNKTTSIKIISKESKENMLGMHIFNSIRIFFNDFVLKVA